MTPDLSGHFSDARVNRSCVVWAHERTHCPACGHELLIGRLEGIHRLTACTECPPALSAVQPFSLQPFLFPATTDTAEPTQ